MHDLVLVMHGWGSFVADRLWAFVIIDDIMNFAQYLDTLDKILVASSRHNQINRKMVVSQNH